MYTAVQVGDAAADENDEMMSIDGCWRQRRRPGHAMRAFFPAGSSRYRSSLSASITPPSPSLLLLLLKAIAAAETGNNEVEQRVKGYDRPR